jgi:hypothetical protein
MPKEELPMQLKVALLALSAMTVAGCSSNLRSVDTPPSRAIASDIEATHQTSPSAITRGERARDEPNGGLPWQPARAR